ncbi:MAG: DOMON-like domain-containing protein [Cyanobacteria bacterium K_Offshore_surface_m2_239]|nr:DOMON-like domain-containing protein [Cyanobacteria bacterium K_Offshore_surface_m2_239]
MVSADGSPLAPEQVHPFVLRPFGAQASRLGLALGGQVVRQGEALRVVYDLRGEVESVLLPAPSPEGPTRRDGLWEHTCFELFLAAEGMEPYWEVNLAPSGDWNLYRLSGYREGLRPELEREALPFTVARGDGRLALAVDLSLPRELALACRRQPLRLGVTAVLEQPAGALSYWALSHGGTVADFHRRDDFLLRFPRHRSTADDAFRSILEGPPGSAGDAGPERRC